MLKTSPRSRPWASASGHPVSFSATSFMKMILPCAQVEITASPMLRRVVDQRSSLARSAASILSLLADVGIRAEPAHHVGLACRAGASHGSERAEYAIRSPQREHHVERLDRWQSKLFHRSSTLGSSFGIVYRLPAPAFHLFGSGSGVLIPALVVPVDPAIRVRRPAQLRDCIQQEFGTAARFHAAPLRPACAR